jgi:hypothetical protein
MIAGTRTLTIATPTGPKPVQITMYLPVQKETDWECAYEIDWPDGPVSSFAAGNDAIAAMHATIEKIGMEVYMSRYHHERSMWWLKPWVGYGLPLPKGARDLLIGHDQEFYGDGTGEP